MPHNWLNARLGSSRVWSDTCSQAKPTTTRRGFRFHPFDGVLENAAPFPEVGRVHEEFAHTVFRADRAREQGAELRLCDALADQGVPDERGRFGSAFREGQRFRGKCRDPRRIAGESRFEGAEPEVEKGHGEESGDPTARGRARSSTGASRGRSRSMIECRQGLALQAGERVPRKVGNLGTASSQPTGSLFNASSRLGGRHFGKIRPQTHR